MAKTHQLWLCVLLLFLCINLDGVGGGGLFHVQHKYGRDIDRAVDNLRIHDENRHGRAGISFPIAGDGKATGTGLYYTKIGIGNPSSDYYVLVDTGSVTSWVDCFGCNKCPTESSLGIKLRLYNPKTSLSAVTCEPSDKRCKYRVDYGDGSSTDGYLVSDLLWFDQVSGNLATMSANARIIFGCGINQTGNLVSSRSFDGLFGFGASSSSMVSQLASSGKSKKKFAHCLDSKNGGGIFVIGDVVQPALQTTPLVSNSSHYKVITNSIQVGDVIISNGDSKETIIDCGSTLAYLPGTLLEQLKQAVYARQANLNIYLSEDLFECFHFNMSIDEFFPTVTFAFDSAKVDVFPHDYLIAHENEQYCLGWLDSKRIKFVDDSILLGDLALSNKLVVYDLDNRILGLSAYDCSSTIGLRDEDTGDINQVAGRNLSSADDHHQQDISSASAPYHSDSGKLITVFILSFSVYFL
ncbi:hypothetical protein MKW94_006050 [Papaver nudicaule]|uniref:Peptidase A1 domain-containing protein n=1 Tax=Papaver nudicaule TaxID=74823 RepID=A0AA41SGJ1_PAPNU|nr:hypothetical protein [Papaver nudicaule]